MKVALTFAGGLIAHTTWEADTRVLTVRMGRFVFELTVGWIDREFPDEPPKLPWRKP
jgi:hypothetical protein